MLNLFPSYFVWWKVYLHFFFKLGFSPCKVEQPLQGMELQEKESKKIKAYKKSV